MTTPALTLYQYTASGNAYKVRLLLALLELPHRVQEVDLFAGQARTPEFLALNPRGQVPVLQDGETVVWDSQAILVYLARRYAGPNWLPLDAAAMATVMQWMAVAENELLFGLARARAVKRFGRPFNFDTCQTYGRTGLALLEQRLSMHAWLGGAAQPSIADVACYPYVGLAPEAELPLAAYPNILAWMARIQALPGYVHMEGIEYLAEIV